MKCRAYLFSAFCCIRFIELENIYAAINVALKLENENNSIFPHFLYDVWGASISIPPDEDGELMYIHVS